MITLLPMQLIRWIVGRKAQILYSILVLLFNGIAVYYLFFFSTSKIDVSSFIPNTAAITSAFEKPFQAVWGKFVFAKPKTIVLPTKIPTPTVVLSPTPSGTDQADLIDCIGPDGKHVWLTQKDCDAFNNAWHVATSSAQPTSEATPSAHLQ